MPDRPNTLGAQPQRDEAAEYRPISAAAVAALMLSVAVALAVLLTLAMSWLVRKRPILVPPLLVLSTISLVLSAVAYRYVRRSEGTRTGLRAAQIAFWLSLLSLGGYGGYYFAIDTAVRQQARAVADQFFAELSADKPELAFRLTRDPDQQRTIPTEAEKIRARFGATDLRVFLQSELSRMSTAWAGSGKFRTEYRGPGERLDDPDGFTLQLTYTLRTPEGQFDVDAWVRGIDDRVTGSRDWQIIFPRTGVRVARQLTQLGRVTAELQMECLRRFLPQRWLPMVPLMKPEELATIVRVNGLVPAAGQRAKLAEQLQAPRAIDLTPGVGPMRAPEFPLTRVGPDGVRLIQVIQVNAPAVCAQCPSYLTVGVVGDDLVKFVEKLSGADWERQPLLPSVEYSPPLADYKYEFKVTELNIRPDLPAIGLQPIGGAKVGNSP
jgi:hypothetical protein